MMPSTRIAQISGFAPSKKEVRALDMKFCLTTSPEPLVKINNYFTEMFLMIPSTRIAQMVLLSEKNDVIALDMKYDKTCFKRLLS